MRRNHINRAWSNATGRGSAEGRRGDEPHDGKQWARECRTPASFVLQAEEAQAGAPSRYNKVKGFFEVVAILPFNYDDAIYASDVMAKLMKKGKKVDEIDVLIAAQAKSKIPRYLRLIKSISVQLLKKPV